ncbi:unnamed protein product [Rhizophagus irregularis]|nr:unnamed protein product [Rhizophagus irregularis]CAB5352329.1 unnamed protein product [Rhizophagus irregularis]
MPKRRKTSAEDKINGIPKHVFSLLEYHGKYLSISVLQNIPLTLNLLTEFWKKPISHWGDSKTWNTFFFKENPTADIWFSHNSLGKELDILILHLDKRTKAYNKAKAMRSGLKNSTGNERLNERQEERDLENNTSESSLNVKSAISNYGLRKKQRIDYNEERISGDQEHFSQAEADIIDFPKIEILVSLETKSHLENYNIICLFDVEFPYTKKIFMTLSTNQLDKLKNKWIDAEAYINQETIEGVWNTCSLKKLVNDYHKVIEENVNDDTLYTDFNALMTAFTRQRALQLLRKHSALQDRSSSEYQYRDEIVNPLLSYIFYDVEDAIWMKTGEIENNSRKRQRNFSKPENERERLGDKHDGILCMNVNGVKVEVGFVEVVGNAFTTITSDKNYDLEKLLKAMMISIWYQKAHLSDGNISNLQSFSILVYGREFHFLSMHLVDTMYIIDEYSAFVIPDSGMSLSQVGNIIKIVKKFKIRIIKYYHQIIKKPRNVTLLSGSGLPIASPSKSAKNDSK